MTAEPNQLLREIGHHRAPVLPGPGQWSTWLNGSATDAEALIGPPPEDFLRAHRVTPRVKNPSYLEEDLLKPLDDADIRPDQSVQNTRQ